MNWQPISTAPKDGTEIIIGGWEYFAGWIWNQSVASWDSQYRIWKDWAENGVHFNCTHWHSISDPPKTEANPLNV